MLSSWFLKGIRFGRLDEFPWIAPLLFGSGNFLEWIDSKGNAIAKVSGVGTVKSPPKRAR